MSQFGNFEDEDKNGTANVTQIEDNTEVASAESNELSLDDSDLDKPEFLPEKPTLNKEEEQERVIDSGSSSSQEKSNDNAIDRQWPNTWAQRLSNIKGDAIDKIEESINIDSNVLDDETKAIVIYEKVCQLIRKEYING